MVLILAAAAAALFVKSVFNLRATDPTRAVTVAGNIRSVAVGAVAEAVVNGVARSVAALLNGLWGATASPNGVRSASRFGEPVGEAG